MRESNVPVNEQWPFDGVDEELLHPLGDAAFYIGTTLVGFDLNGFVQPTGGIGGDELRPKGLVIGDVHQRAAVRTWLGREAPLRRARKVNRRASHGLPFMSAPQGPIVDSERRDFTQLQWAIADTDGK